MGATPAGDIVLSATTAALLAPAERKRLTALGLHELRGVSEPVDLLGLSGDGRAWSGRPLLSAKPRNLHLPKPASDMVGRQNEVAALTEEIGRRRLITLAGPGGVGKSRLALELAWLSAARFDDGVWFVELAPVTDPAAVAAAVAAEVDARPHDGASLEEALVSHLSDRSALVVLDNCEHLIDAVADLVDRLLAACPRLTVVATSREALGLGGEVVWPVPSLDADLEGPELFRARVLEADATTLPPSAIDDAQIVRICRRLDGTPWRSSWPPARAG